MQKILAKEPNIYAKSVCLQECKHMQAADCLGRCEITVKTVRLPSRRVTQLPQEAQFKGEVEKEQHAVLQSAWQ